MQNSATWRAAAGSLAKDVGMPMDGRVRTTFTATFSPSGVSPRYTTPWPPSPRRPTRR
ncbi:hypothetical protein [Microbispora sp. NPDC049633]|uniref:hypothetical protein n=1 Tax=Microbispora sp. NPDC049633 TaxID=3154355 RepID=UPI0034334ABB